eukprot:TRINITY_DN2115_c0_g1_i1.p1 TRINITY_DN2115_c0_g1~~TRINITY_DN2115_c0_g1_i1.p1  ORF type:complete len:598 (-),score=139.19 TRINITY_DN2115_c0_g1_i1:1179-2972(-)
MDIDAKLKSIFAPSAGVQRGFTFHLSAHPKKDEFVYCSGNFVVIRNLKDPGLVDLYTGHQHAPTVAKYSFSGYHVASGDSSGQVRMWDTVNPEHISMTECHPVGVVSDLAWSNDNQRLVVVGDGKECAGNTILAKGGASIGKLLGHTGRIISCDFRPTRPFRVVTGGEDNLCNFYEGPPFKFKQSATDHTRFVNCVRYSPDGSLYVSVGGDGRGFIYDGKDSAKTGELSTEGGHKGSIYSCSWSPDNKQLLTCGADKTAKLWDITTGQVVNTWNVSATPTAQHMLLGSLWKDQYMLVVGLNEDIYYLDPVSNTPYKTLQGHSKPITSMIYDKTHNTVITGGSDGRCNNWNFETGLATSYQCPPSTQIGSLALSQDSLLAGCNDNALRFASFSQTIFKDDSTVETPGVATDIALSSDGTAFVASKAAVIAVKDGKTSTTMKVAGEVFSVAVSPACDEVAVGASDNNVYLFTPAGEQKNILKRHRGVVSAVAYSPDGKYLASADHQRSVLLWDRATSEVLIDSWVFHSSRINALAWSPDSKHVASAGNDAAIYVWNVDKPLERVRAIGAHPRGVSAVAFVNNNTLVSAGQDACVKTWTF